MSSIITTINSDNGGFLGKKYHPGNGLELTEANVFNVLVDNDSMKVNEENKLESKKYQAGNGLELTEDNGFNVLIDNDSIKINEENKLEATNKNNFWEESEGQLVPKNYDNEVRAKNLPFKNSAGTNIYMIYRMMIFNRLKYLQEIY